MFAGYDYRQLHLTHQTEGEVTFELEVDRQGNNQWHPLVALTVGPGEAVSHLFSADESGAWIRLICRQPAQEVTAHFQYRDRDSRNETNAQMFAGVATVERPVATYGLMRSVAYDRLGIVAATNADGSDAAYYELNPKMQLLPVDRLQAAEQLVASVQQPRNAIAVDEASVLIVEDGKRYRLPKNEQYVVRTADQNVSPKTLESYLDQNLATAATVVASSTHADYAPSHVVDGSLTDQSRWIGKNAGDTWIALDLGSEKTFRSIWVVSGWKQSSQYVAGNFDVQVQVDGIWQTIPGAKVRDNSAIQTEIVLDAPVTARHVRLLTDSDDFFRIYEFAIFDRDLDVTVDGGSFGLPRVCREVATERDLLNVHGSFYELPARNAQGVAKIRPVATHNLRIHDFCSHNGLLLLTGVDAMTENEHIFRSADGRAAVWAGVVDDMWELGKPRGLGGPWKETQVKAGEPSDPYLMTGYDHKDVVMSSITPVRIRLEVDIDGTGLWIPYRAFNLEAGQVIEHAFPEGFSAYWVRAISDSDTTATVMFSYH